jgi:hypothetical protein
MRRQPCVDFSPYLGPQIRRPVAGVAISEKGAPPDWNRNGPKESIDNLIAATVATCCRRPKPAAVLVPR